MLWAFQWLRPERPWVSRSIVQLHWWPGVLSPGRAVVIPLLLPLSAHVIFQVSHLRLLVSTWSCLENVNRPFKYFFSCKIKNVIILSVSLWWVPAVRQALCWPLGVLTKAEQVVFKEFKLGWNAVPKHSVIIRCQEYYGWETLKVLWGVGRRNIKLFDWSRIVRESCWEELRFYCFSFWTPASAA